MGKPSPKKNEKRRKKKQKQREHSSKYVARKEAFRKFPEVVYDTANSPTALEQAVRNAMSEFVAEHEQLLHKLDAFLVQEIRSIGMSGVREQFREMAADLGSEINPEIAPGISSLEARLYENLGDAFLSKLPSSARRYFPFHAAILIPGEPSDKQILMRILSLAKRKTPGGTAYYSANAAAVDFGENIGDKIVAFSRHAIERICDRTVPNASTYEGIKHAHLSCTEKLIQIPQKLSAGCDAFALFYRCVPGMQAEYFARGVLGTYYPREEYFWRVGYCPVAIHDDLAVAKTLLLPGMDGTPEFQKSIRPTIRSHSERQHWRDEIEEATLGKLLDDDDFTLLKRFHDDGIPQVLTQQEFMLLSVEQYSEN